MESNGTMAEGLVRARCRIGHARAAERASRVMRKYTIYYDLLYSNLLQYTILYYILYYTILYAIGHQWISSPTGNHRGRAAARRAMTADYTYKCMYVYMYVRLCMCICILNMYMYMHMHMYIYYMHM